MTELLLTLISAALINNLVLHWPLGVDPVLGSERRQVHALGIATTCLMLIVGTLGHALYHWLLVPLGLTSLQLFVFLPLSVLLIGPLLKLLPRLFAKLSFEGLWPLLLGNAGVLGLTLLNAQDDKGLFHAIALSLGAGLGFWLVLSLFSDLRQRTLDNDVPLPFRGLPIELIGAGLITVVFLGFSGLIKT
ncbi:MULTISPECIES: Rnf-Nqr domain containing protein [Pseudomonas]|jgi:electron transport complex protein RnfA|uniref:Rnf-Nqr domain containing protein n=1 Tax=Pseudomonas TaxID=286 RepID=UPI000B354674|nr:MULTISPECIES: Rnf-Nqr domain containing protein [Pseudomonas]MBD9608961.1 NADH:quinone oxidoreductase [Pseudomonas sp. PDM08]MDR7107848.1 electron transport complex protein RnfA [Pseudomonas frederiksbergensis]PMY51335.1 NADH:quinone oxidoreductase [Pseudomonas sp. FW305-53]PMY83994.1 NADH:quinone oxidoreductase [Pseudomonas sp. FW303-C2]PMY90440.1 NADH:quinone oxidoreductase [Pseudomonas sp. FW305-62]